MIRSKIAGVELPSAADSENRIEMSQVTSRRGKENAYDVDLCELSYFLLGVESRGETIDTRIPFRRLVRESCETFTISIRQQLQPREVEVSVLGGGTVN